MVATKAVEVIALFAKPAVKYAKGLAKAIVMENALDAVVDVGKNVMAVVKVDALDAVVDVVESVMVVVKVAV